MSLRTAFFTVTRNVFSTSAVYQATANSLASKESIVKETITNHLELLKKADNSNIYKNEIKIGHNDQKPLVVLLGWLLAKPHHLKKYADIYIDKGFNVLTISMSPWQFFWPKTGAHLIADELLNYLKMGPSSQPLILHGFSVGAYLWGECLIKMTSDLSGYSSVINRIKGQIWDSAPDISELHKGLPNAIAPNNAALRWAVEVYFSFHLRRFYDAATQHYIRSSELFHNTPVRAPSLIFVCKNDPIASYSSNKKVQDSWDYLGIKTFMKCWDKSKHVSHIVLHQKEYMEALDDFLSNLNLSSEVEKQSGSLNKIASKL